MWNVDLLLEFFLHGNFSFLEKFSKKVIMFMDKLIYVQLLSVAHDSWMKTCLWPMMDTWNQNKLHKCGQQCRRVKGLGAVCLYFAA